ncbi:hypothetical protein DTO164E3_687 [Paecilomyces variotii]|nr:hypothetical protein DTO164E3_687 [Paecilomyces variotii]
MFRSPRSNSRLSTSSKQGGGSRASDDDAKTAVKVAVRVRPPLKPNDPGYELIPQRFQRSMVHVTSPTSLAVDVPQGRKLFVFDRVFPETVDQEGIWEYLSDSVSSFVQGYNVSILAYGQSGAGKSYTMGTSGPSEQNNSKAMGVIPRAAQQLFEKLDGTPTHTRSASSGIRTPSRYSMSSTTSFGRNGSDKNWQLKATYVEIYNEQLRDLLVPDATDRAAVTIREDAKGRIILTGLHQVTINSFEDLIGALNFGSSIRQTDSTAVNAKSSRSHAVFSLNLVQRKSPNSTSAKEKRLSMPVEAMSGSDASVTVDSKLHFVDLAGSERLKNTGASGERAREGISINAGLASLGKVISQLSSRQSGAHVSYRDSKLTRLLQDSLGGNAITYMIACVTPAEFHLSETLNTVQYAQRARAIQSKPRIQQVTDENDKQAIIDRLKAEIAFLRQQIRNSEAGDRRSVAPAERSERQNEREIELQNHLLDVQESYNALSQRHAKLMAELTKASEFSGEPEEIASLIGNNSVERLRRSHSFAESVEQVVLEYEKTIQSLESSLSNTRSSLSSTESNLLERETKLAYVETVNAQLQARLQKMMDREANTETYLHDLESKLDGHTSGEEQQSAVVAELRRELARVRETAASCEDYISTLEERLAEADQDMELMQREIERLEHVVDRQRSLGKLDNLLYELDHIQQNGTKKVDDVQGEHASEVVSRRGSYRSRKRAPSLDVLAEAAETAIPESDDDLAERMPDVEEEEEELPADVTEDSGLGLLERASKELGPNDVPARHEYAAESPAQSQFVAEKLDTVTQELLDLRMQHEATITEYDALSAKYEEALRALEKLQQDAADESRHPTAPAAGLVSPTATSRPSSFLGDPRVHQVKTGAHHSSSQSLSSELSLAGESAGSPEASDSTAPSKTENGDVPVATENIEFSKQEVESMRRLLSEHQEGMTLVTQKYAQLQAEHEETLGLIEHLKAQVQKAKSTPSPTSPGPKGGVIRRMTSQNLMSTVDRAHRSLAALRNIAAEEFEDRPDTMQNFELNLNAAMHELHTRMERIQSLEAENMSVKKEMETKSTIISGLARERSSLQGGTADMTVVSQLREQLVQQDNQMKELQQMHEKGEKDLLAQIQNLNALLESQEAAAKASDVHAEKQEQKISELESELCQWKGKHQTAIESLQSSETRLKETLAELEASLAAIETMRSQAASASDTSAQEMQADLERERQRHQEVVDGLMKEIEDHKSTIAVHLETISGLEKSHAAAQEQLAQRERSEVTDDDEITSYKTRISELEQEISTHKSIIDAQKKDLESLQESHSRELAELESRVTAAVQAEHESRLAEQNEAMDALRSEISESKDELTKLLDSVSKVLSTPVTAASLSDQLEDIVAQKQDFSNKYLELIDANEELTKRLDMNGNLDDKIKELTEKSSQQESKVNELAQLIAELEEVIQQKEEEVKKKDAIIEEINAEKDKSARLVEELEEQITNSFDQHQNRLSVIQQERGKALEDANAKIAVHEKDIESYRARIEQLEAQLKRNSGAQDGSLDRNGSITSNLRKNSSTASLPSPPPAIPLPPLPTIASAASGNAGSMSPPSSRHTSKELVNAQLVEDQEARIRTIEKHLYAEKQLTATLEEALGDLEAQSNKVKADMEAWKKKAWQYEDELTQLRKERNSTRLSIQAVEEERNARREAEAARAQLEERMNAINKKKKKSTLNCF